VLETKEKYKDLIAELMQEEEAELEAESFLDLQRRS